MCSLWRKKQLSVRVIMAQDFCLRIKKHPIGSDSEEACNMKEGGKSRDNSVDFIRLFYLYGKPQTRRRTVLGTKRFIWCQVSN